MLGFSCNFMGENIGLALQSGQLSNLGIVSVINAVSFPAPLTISQVFRLYSVQQGVHLLYPQFAHIYSTLVSLNSHREAIALTPQAAS